MNDKKKSATGKLEVSSDQLKNELTEIKDRVSALETIATISNRAVVEAYVRAELKTDKAVPILIECEEPRTREYLIAKFGFKSGQALDHHLKPLKQADLVHQHFDDDGTLTLEWSNLFRRLPNTVLKSILKKK